MQGSGPCAWRVAAWLHGACPNTGDEAWNAVGVAGHAVFQVRFLFGAKVCCKCAARAVIVNTIRVIDKTLL